MPASLYREPPRAMLAGLPAPGAVLTFSVAGGTTPTEVFADADLTTPIANPLTADIAGRFQSVYFDSAGPDVRAICETSDGVELWDEDDIDPAGAPYARGGNAYDNSGELMPDASNTFYLVDTTQLATIYTNGGLSIEAANPSFADQSGFFDAIYTDSEVAYRVIQSDGSGELIYDIQSLVGLPYIGPSAPVLSGIFVLPDNELDWTASSAGTFAVDYYQLERSFGGGAYVAIATVPFADPREYIDADVDSGDYEYRVRAFDVNGNSGEYSNVIEITVVALNVVLQLQFNTGVAIESAGVPHVDYYDGTGFSGVSSAQIKFGSASYHNKNEFIDHTNYVDARDNIDLARFVFSGPFTMEGWFYRDTDGGGELSTLFANGISPSDGYFFLGPHWDSPGFSGEPANSITFEYNSLGSVNMPDLIMGYSAWVFVAITRDTNDVVRVFLDGVPSATQPTISGPFGAIYDSATHFTICEGVPFVSADFDGYFDQVRVTRNVCRYTTTFTPPGAPFPPL